MRGRKEKRGGGGCAGKEGRCGAGRRGGGGGAHVRRGVRGRESFPLN